MKCNPLLTISCSMFLVSSYSQESAQLSNALQPAYTAPGCQRSIFVESPIADTYVSSENDTISHGNETVLKVRGFPERKAMQTMLSYEVHHLDPNYLQTAYLRVYTASKDRGDHLQVLVSDLPINESKTNWKNQPKANQVLDEQPVTAAPFVKFNVTDYVRGHLKDGFLNFHLKTNSKKIVEIASRESGLSAELILEMCTVSEPEPKSDKTEESHLKVLPSTLEGKLTVELTKVPAGGFGTLMFMTDQGDILFQIPLSIQDADVSYHTVDFNNLLPGVYWAVLRKGRVMVKDQFRLKPENGTTFLKVDGDYLAQREN